MSMIKMRRAFLVKRTYYWEHHGMPKASLVDFNGVKYDWNNTLVVDFSQEADVLLNPRDYAFTECVAMQEHDAFPLFACVGDLLVPWDKFVPKHTWTEVRGKDGNTLFCVQDSVQSIWERMKK